MAGVDKSFEFMKRSQSLNPAVPQKVSRKAYAAAESQSQKEVLHTCTPTHNTHTRATLCKDTMHANTCDPTHTSAHAC